MRALKRWLAVVLAGGLAGEAVRAEPSAQPVLQVDYPFPTADKPQSKTWFSHGCWWAVLPRLAGPSLWQRTGTGWVEHTEVRAALAGVPGRADVWWDGESATAVSAADRIIRVFRLRPLAADARLWQAEVLATLPAPADDAIETITLARDPGGLWWIATAVQEKIFAWSSRDGAQWSPPETIGRGIEADDICTVAPLREGVGVIWSDQKHETVNLRVHRTGRPATAWEAVEVVQAGDRNADDHLHAVLATDGTLWVATKNSVDAVGEPQLVLRVRSPEGRWRNVPYGRLTADDSVSRPTVALAPDGAVWLGHSVYREKIRSEIVFGTVDLASAELLHAPRAVIAPEAALHARVNDPTGPKGVFPEHGAWLVLASDAAGRVYEADLRAPGKP
ncbi:MAG: hypothetical protein NTV51_15515 [Verrucomicrobia bacterium]|nr:hypothetical protein [Verrucomicrobiota bacterium]